MYKESVVGSRHRLTKNGQLFILEEIKEVRGNQSYSIDYLLSRNEDYKNNGEIVNIDWNETFKRFPDTTPDFFKSKFSDLIKGLKISIGLPTNEDYLEVKRLGALKPSQMDDYIGWLELSLISLSKYVPVNSELDEMKAEYEQLAGKKPNGLWKEKALTKEINLLKENTLNA